MIVKPAQRLSVEISCTHCFIYILENELLSCIILKPNVINLFSREDSLNRLNRHTVEAHADTHLIFCCNLCDQSFSF